MILSHLERLVVPFVKVLRARFVHWTKPFTSSLPLRTLANLARSKAEFMAENALLRQQLIILKRQVKRPTCTKRDRILLVLLARAVRAWKQTLLIIQPETLLRWHRELFLCWLHGTSVRDIRRIQGTDVPCSQHRDRSDVFARLFLLMVIGDFNKCCS